MQYNDTNVTRKASYPQKWPVTSPPLNSGGWQEVVDVNQPD